MNNNHGPGGEWLVENFDDAALPELITYFANDIWTSHWSNEILSAAAAKLKGAAVPLFIAALDACRQRAAKWAQKSADQKRDQQYRIRQELTTGQAALGHLTAHHDGQHD